MLLEAEAQADMQTKLTNARVKVQIAESHGEADLAVARKQAEQTVVVADAELARSRREAEQTVVLAEAERQARSARRPRRSRSGSRRSVWPRRRCCCGRSLRTATRGCTRCRACRRHLSQSTQPLVPERVFMAGGDDGNGNGSRRRQPGRRLAGLAREPAGGREVGLPIGRRQPGAGGPAVVRREDRRGGDRRRSMRRRSRRRKLVRSMVEN